MKDFKTFYKWHFFLVILRNPALWWRSIDFIVFRPFRTRLRIKLKGMYSPSYYPKDIHRLWKSIDKTESCQYKYSDWSSIFKTPLLVNKVSGTINLAGTKLAFNEILKVWNSDTKYSTLEPEFHNAAHRFHWVLEKIANGVCPEYMSSVYSLLDHWLEEQSKNQTGYIWQPYTVSERICNWIVIWQVGQSIRSLPLNLEKKINLELLNHLLFLSEHLEYPASGIINNHILNNARALYVGGKFIKRNDFSDLGKNIILKHSSDMIGESGFLLEASSHYHLLLTRTYIEIRNIAKKENDIDFYQWLVNITNKMVSAVEYLVPRNLKSLDSFPRIGDVSPDIPFSWFFPSTTNYGWGALWVYEHISVTSKRCENDGWVNLLSRDWSVISYLHPNNNVYPTGHGHEDFGSFELYFKGHPVLVDIGRFNYSKPQAVRLVGLEAEAHNSILINSKSTLPAGSGYRSILSGYLRKYSEAKIISDKNKIKWKNINNASTKWSRCIELNESGDFQIIDSFNSACLSKINGYLYFSPGYIVHKINNNNLELKFENLEFKLQFEGVKEVRVEKTPFYPEYGVCIEAIRIHWTILPVTKLFIVKATITNIKELH